MIINLIKSYEKLKSISANSENKIFIYGAGKQGEELYYEFCELGIKIDAFLDLNYEQFNNGMFCDIPVLYPKSILEMPLDKIFVAISVANFDNYQQTVAKLEKYGLKKWIHFADFGIDNDRRSSDLSQLKPYLNSRKFPALAEIVKSKQKSVANSNQIVTKKAIPDFSIDVSHLNDTNYIASLDFVITNYCNLRCKFCSHAIPYCKKHENFDAQQITQDLDKLLDVSYVSCLGILGGEPFLHPKFYDVIRNISNLKNLNKIESIRIVTNAVLLPKDDLLKSLLNIPNVYVYISNYGEKSKNMNNLIDKCNAFGIPLYVCPYESYWQDLGDFSYSRNYTSLELENLFKFCGVASACFQLINGKLYSCPRLPSLNEHELIPYNKSAFIDVRNTPIEHLNSNLSDYLYNRILNCQFCDGVHKFSPIVERG